MWEGLVFIGLASTKLFFREEVNGTISLKPLLALN